jgi:hypothetical protein
LTEALICLGQRSTASRIAKRSRELSHCQSLSSCGLEKRAVASDHDDVRVTDSVGSREVDRVMSAQLTSLSQLARSASEGVINLDQVHLLEQGVERSDSDAARAEPASEISSGMTADVSK